MDRATNPRGLGSNERPVGNTLFLLSPYNPKDHEHNSDLLDTYERERISRELEYYIEEAAKSATTNVKSNGVIGSDRPISHRSRLQRVMSMPVRPPERDTSGGGNGMKKKVSEKQSKEILTEAMMPAWRSTSGGGMKKKSETKSKETIEVSMPPERDTRSGGGMKKKKSETKYKAIMEGNFLLKHASTVCNTSESAVVQFGRDFLRAQLEARWLPGKKDI